jgi:hypothetical protein
MTDNNSDDFMIPRILRIEGGGPCRECGSQNTVASDAVANRIPYHCASCGADYVMEFVFARRCEGDPDMSGPNDKQGFSRWGRIVSLTKAKDPMLQSRPHGTE